MHATMNATELVEALKPSTTGLDHVIHTFKTLNTFFHMVSWLWDGFPQMLDWCAGFIPSVGAISIFRYDQPFSLGNILRLISLFMFGTLILEFTSGVQILP